MTDLSPDKDLKYVSLISQKPLGLWKKNLLLRQNYLREQYGFWQARDTSKCTVQDWKPAKSINTAFVFQTNFYFLKEKKNN